MMGYRSNGDSSYLNKYCSPKHYSRAFDCCSHQSSKRSSLGDKYIPTPTAPTYGTYFYPAKTDRCYRNKDSANCSCDCCPHDCKSPPQDRRGSKASGYESGSSKSRKTKRERIDAVDKTDGPLRRRHGKKFPVSISRDATVRDILDMLAPDGRRHKVMILWDDGERELLHERIPMREIRKYATLFEIKDNKHVHWS